VSALTEANYAVAFSYLEPDAPAHTLVAELTATGARVLGLESDVGLKTHVEAFFEQVVSWHGDAPALLVNNAGIQTHAALLDLDESQWDAVIRTNLKGCFLNTQAAARLMIGARRGGAIVNIGSGCNKLGFPQLVDYTASKGGIEQFTKAAAIELGPHGIRVNCVAPGAIETARTLAELPDYSASWSSITPLRRIGTPEDISSVVLFFASPAAKFVTGQTLWVDGGVFSQARWPSLVDDV
jgi:3-oxoacyl-[acyl-carrier protein] reductase